MVIVSTHRPIGANEFLVAAGALVAGLLLHFWIAGAFALFPRHLWLDEVLTFMLVSDPDWRHAGQALAGAVDTNPPGFHLILRAFCAVSGGVTPVNLRIFSCVSIYLALLGLYACLRQSLGILAAIAGILALWSMPLIVHHTFEARFYGPLLATTAWLAFCFIIVRRTKQVAVVYIAIAFLSIIVCTVHYFGVLALVAIAAGAMFAHRDRQAVIASAVACVSGFIALCACIPLFLSQRTGLRASTWVDPVNFALVREYVDDLFPSVAVILTLLIVCLYLSFNPAARSTWRDRNFWRDLVPWTHLAPLLATAMVAGVVMVFSVVVQPALVARYAIPSTLAGATAVAILVSKLPVRWQVGTVTLLAFACIAPRFPSPFAESLHRRTPLASNVYRWTTFDSNVDRLISDIRAEGRNAIVIFELRQYVYPVVAAAPDLRDICFYFDSTGIKRAGHFELYESDMAARVQHFYGWPRVLTPRNVPLDRPLFRIDDNDQLVRMR